MRTKPFIRWAGGKQNLVDDIISTFPPPATINNYFEPFVGAGSIFFASALDNATLSDINFQLVNSYKQIKDNYQKVNILLQKYHKEFNIDTDFYYRLRELYNRDIAKPNHIQAARFIFLIHSNYNGMYRVNKKGEYNVPIGKLMPNIPDRLHLRGVSEKLQTVELSCMPFKDVLKYVTAEDLVYLDPPYPPLDWENPQNQYTVDHFSLEDHQDVALLANELNDRGCFVLISYPDIQLIRQLYEGWTITQLNTFRSISCKKERRKISEILIRNY